MNTRKMNLVSVLVANCIWATMATGQQPESEPQFPVKPIVFADEPFKSCEGVSFNGEGHMYVTCNNALWRVSVDGAAERIADLHSNLGVAGIGDHDLLVADFGPSNAFGGGRNSDGIVWRITPDGNKTKDALGIGDPNVVLVRADGSYLVSDDATSDIYAVQPGGEVSLFTTAVNHPNGLVISGDGSTLFVAQMFTNIRPVVGVGLLWAIRLQDDGAPARAAKLVADAGPGAFADGIAMDKLGRVYITANRIGKIWRFDPNTDEMTLIADGVFGAASVVFGEGEFDRQSIYVTTTFSGGVGGIVWRIPVGIEGAPVIR